ncbi:MAG TPA: glutamine-hydrolyzing GMP synthase, partial [Patescibacteria group bacterium]|nr:glutamine-hydrolyzing GMP synthase [Patescibacteria group bacterium]
MKNTYIAILDFGSQYMHLISRRIRQMGVLAKIYPTDINAHELKDALGIIISGGPNSVNDQKLVYDPGIFELNIPVLGLCYGHQLMAFHLKGVVTPAHNREYGKAQVHIDTNSPLFNGLSKTEQAWMSHWDSVTTVPPGFQVIGKTNDCPVAAMAHEKKRFYGLQLHPEVHHTTNGSRILKNFVFTICGATPNWSMQQYLKQLEQELKRFVGEKKVFLLVSGGVDSSVAFALLQKILGKNQVYGLHIDNGFMRLNEAKRVYEALVQAGFDDLHVVNESVRFLEAVKGVADPEQKRKIIGKTFLQVEKDALNGLGLNPDEWLLGQGTIYPDTIESGGTKTSDKIKTHHNRVDEILELINAGKVVEPLAELYKDEVRELGKRLALPTPMLERWPFPGPGLSIRCLCSSGTVEPIEQEQQMNAAIQTY